MELDQSLTHADEQRLETELHLTELELLRHQALTQLLNQHKMQIITQNQVQKNNWTAQTPNEQIDSFELIKSLAMTLPTQSTAEQIQYYRQLLYQQWQEYLSEYHALQSSYVRQVAEKDSIQARIKQYKATLPLIKKRSAAIKKLVDRQLAAEMTWLETEEKHIEQQQELAVEQSRKKMLRASINETKHQFSALASRTQSRNLTETGELRRQRLSLIEELNKAQSLDDKQILRAPVSGEIQELAIHTIGGIVTPAQKLMVIIPANDTLQVEARLENKDIGFIYEGQRAEIKVHTFPFTKYGVIDAQVTNLSDNAIADEQLGLIYKMRLLMEQSEILVNGKMVKLMPGMTVTVEVKTGTRRLIEFFLAPLLRYKSESLDER